MGTAYQDGQGTVVTTESGHSFRSKRPDVTNAEIAVLDDLADELALLAGMTSTATELNILDGATVTVAEVNKLDDSVEDVYADGIGLARIAKATYDFDVDAGAAGAIDLGVTIPANSIIIGGLVDVVTTCTTAGTDVGTGALSIESADDLVAAVAVSDGAGPWDQGLHAIIPVMTAASAVKTTDAANLTFTIATQDFTAGKFHLIVYYIPTVVDTAG